MERHRRVVVFGAGASHGARKPQPPLGKCLHEYVSKYLSEKWGELSDLEDDKEVAVQDKVRHKLKQLLDCAGSFELLATKLWKEGEKDLLGKINFTMACALTPPINDDPKVDNEFVEKRDVYDYFLHMTIRNSEELEYCSFITLNYDCLLERAICRSFFRGPLDGEIRCFCQHVNYRLPDGSCSGVEVLKPHGSINWFGNILGDSIKGNRIPITVRLEPDGRPTYEQIDLVHSPIGQDHEALVIAHYAPGKKPQANPTLLENIQNLARERIRKADVIEVIGVHLPSDSSDDPFLSDLLGLMKQRVTEGGCPVDYVSPDKDEIYSASSCFGFKVRQCSFEEHVKRAKSGTSGQSV